MDDHQIHLHLSSLWYVLIIMSEFCTWWWARKLFTPLVFSVSSSYLVVTNLPSTKIGNCHIWFFFRFTSSPFLYISRRTSPKCYRTQTQTRQEVAKTRDRGHLRMRWWWTRVISNQERTALLRTRCTIDPGRATPCAELAGLQRVQTEIHCTSLHLLSMWIHHSSQLKHSFIIEAWRQDGQLSRIWSGLWLYSNY